VLRNLFTLFIILLNCSSFAGEAELFVALEAFKNQVKISGYSDELHSNLLAIFDEHKDKLNTYQNKDLKQELAALTKSSHLVQGLKKCVDTAHDKINKGIDNLFNGMVSGDCLSSYFAETTLDSLVNETNTILEEIAPTENLDISELRKNLFDSSLPGLMNSFNHSRNLFKDTDEKFFADASTLFPLLPEDKRNLDVETSRSEQTYDSSSRQILGPIHELYENVYGDRAENALSDEWMATYTRSREGEQPPHLFTENAEEAMNKCFSRIEEIKALQTNASEHFQNLRGLTHSLGLSGIIPAPTEFSGTDDTIGFSEEPKCVGISQGIAGRHNIDRYGKALDSRFLERGGADILTMENKTVALTLGELGSDPNNVFRPIGTEGPSQRSFLGNYSAAGIEENHNKSLEGMLGFINHMGRRVYNTQSDSAGGRLVDGAGDIAQSITSLGGSDEVDVALLLMANPSQGMSTLINTPGAAQAFCASFKSLRNQDNVNQVLEVAAALSMFTGVGGMVVKGGSLLGRGLRVTNFALAGADALSVTDSISHARDLALASACDSSGAGDESLCQTYLNSDRNLTVALAGLAFAGAGAGASSVNRLARRFRGTSVLRNGENVRGVIADNQKLNDLLNGASESQKTTLMSLLSSGRLSDDDSHKLISLIQNNDNVKTLSFLDRYSKLGSREKDALLRAMINKADNSGGVCTLPGS
jgi:hypothetical protein